MKIFVVNLPRIKERKDSMLRQLARIKEEQGHYEIVFFNAIDASKGEHLSFKQYSPLKSLLFRGKPMSDGERACFGSHYRLWEKCIELNEPIVVLEDDVEIFKGFYKNLNHIAKSGYVYVRLMYTKINAKLHILPDDFYIGFAPLAGTQGYYLTPTAARAFINGASSWFCPVDDYMDMYYIHHIPNICIKPILAEKYMPTTIEGRWSKVAWYLKIPREFSRLYFQLRKILYLSFFKKTLLMPKDALNSLGGGYAMLDRKKPFHLIENFRDKDVILAYSKKIEKLSLSLPKPLYIMEVCGGHTHTLMRYGLLSLLPKNINFIHGPGCPVCIMPKNRINQAYEIAMQKDVILITLGDMIKIPGTHGSLADARAKGADVRFVYSPMQVLEIAKANRDKRVVFFAIGFETTTPMSAAIIEHVLQEGLTNVLFHINHVLVPPPLHVILSDKMCAINALIAPSHVSVISGAKIYKEIVERYALPVVVSGFEPVDMMESIYMIVSQALNAQNKLEIQYKRVVSMEGNLKAQALIGRYFEKRDSFEWRGLGEIRESALKLKPEYAHLDAELAFDGILSKAYIPDNKACRCGDILRGQAKPTDCKVFAKACTPSNPLGSCMVSSEGACAAYYKYGGILR